VQAAVRDQVDLRLVDSACCGHCALQLHPRATRGFHEPLRLVLAQRGER